MMVDRLNEAMLRGWVFVRHGSVREDGASMAEYGLLLALVAVVAIAGLTGIGSGLKGKFQQVADNLN
jgi:pilus assembly protein Flp/PilA